MSDSVANSNSKSNSYGSKKSKSKRNKKELVDKLKLENEELKKKLAQFESSNSSVVLHIETKSENSLFDDHPQSEYLIKKYPQIKDFIIHTMESIVDIEHTIHHACYKEFEDSFTKEFEKNKELNFKLDTIKQKCTCGSITGLDSEFEAKKKAEDNKKLQEEAQYKYDQEQKDFVKSLTKEFHREYDRLLKNSDDMSTLLWDRRNWSHVLHERCRLKCGARAIMLRKRIDESKELQELGIYVDCDNLEINHYCFRVLLPKGSIVSKISCSVPTDANGNYDIKDEEVPTTLETAIMDSDDKFIYCDEIGYNGCYPRFWKDEDLINEILKIARVKGTYKARKNSIEFILQN